MKRGVAGARSTDAPGAAVVTWLLRGDPSIRAQALRDLLDAPVSVWQRERARVAREGWGARLLARQGSDGRWAGGPSPDRGLYSPKWISTTYTLLLLRDLELAPSDRRAHAGCRHLLERGRQRDGGINYDWGGRSELCITGMVLSILCYFGHGGTSLDELADFLLHRQMPDGGWNCRYDLGAVHSSFHTTISALEGLLLYERRRGRGRRGLAGAQRRGREFLLAHRLFRSHRTGEVVKPIFLRFAFPPRWHYDVLRALDHFRAAGAPRGPRLGEAVELVRAARSADGRWPLHHAYRGRTYFSLEKVGGPSRWNTLRALRVLRWWEGESAAPAAATRGER